MNNYRAFVLGFFCFGLNSLALASGDYVAEIRTTSYGISHVKADDWGSLGYGYGYVYANHNLCILAREVVEANGQQAFYFGDSPNRVEQDFYYTLVNNDQFIDNFLSTVSADGLALVQGYAAGYNAFLAATGLENLPVECREQPWVRPITERDLFKVFYKLILRASGGQLINLIYDAAPPSSALKTKTDFTELRKQIVSSDLSALSALRKPMDLGSNMYALGSNATQNGRGMVLGNPHFPWSGPLRWYQIHLTIPGELDVMGASLQGIPLVNIGFTENFAWSHTVSPAWRFTLFEVPLVSGNPLQYLFDGVAHDFEQHSVSIQVTTNTGVELREHTFYRSVHGWMLDFNDVLGFSIWSSGVTAFALGDANAGNLRAIEQFMLMDKAQSLAEFVDVLQTNIGLPWVHTVAADNDGNAFYGDLSVVPNVDQAKIDYCPGPSLGGIISSLSGLVVLNGGSTACQWDVAADSPQAGILGVSQLPALQTTDYVTNSNDNHWLSNPEQPLEGFSPLFGSEQSQRSLRTRLGLLQVAQRLAGNDGLGAPGFTLDTLKENLFGSRNFAGEMLAVQLAQLCTEEGPEVDVDGTLINVSQACSVLANWDQRQNLDSVGAQVMLEFLQSVNDADDDPLFVELFANPFDVLDPVITPNGLATADQADRDRWMGHLAEAVQKLADNAIALDAPWGDIQFEEKNGVRYPIHGGRDGSGMFSIITANLSTGLGYTPIQHGNSYMQAVSWDDDGVIADALLSYSQSSDPDNENYADQTDLYANKLWVRLPFTDEQIQADADFSSFTLTAPRTGDVDLDGVADNVDNCTETANPLQRDTDSDGFGNYCDPDFNQDNQVNLDDLAYLRTVFFSNDDLGDLNGDGQVNLDDLSIVRDLFFGPPGPGCGPL